jgi:hypothetical protein
MPLPIQPAELEAEDFIERYGSKTFKHHKEILEGLEKDELDLSSFTGGPKNKVTGKILTDIYGRKAKTLTGEESQKQLLDDLIDLCHQLSDVSSEIIDVWSFVSSQSYYSVFVSRKDDVIRGVVITIAEGEGEED